MLQLNAGETFSKLLLQERASNYNNVVKLPCRGTVTRTHTVTMETGGDPVRLEFQAMCTSRWHQISPVNTTQITKGQLECTANFELIKNALIKESMENAKKHSSKIIHSFTKTNNHTIGDPLLCR